MKGNDLFFNIGKAFTNAFVLKENNSCYFQIHRFLFSTINSLRIFGFKNNSKMI